MSLPVVDRLGVAAEFDRSAAWEKGGSVRYLVVQVTAPTEVSRLPLRPIPLNLALVVDASGSMNGGKLEAAKQAAADLVERLGSRDVLSVVSFASQVVTHVEPMTLAESGKRSVLEAILGLHARDNTNLSGGWLRGAECVGRYLAAHPDCRNRVLLLSDGHANEGITDPRELGLQAERLSGQGIHSSAVGIGSDYSSNQLEAIAGNGGGQLHRATAPPEIVEVVMGELGDIAATVAENISVEARYPQGVRLELLGDFPVVAGEQQISCQLGSLIATATRLAIFKITVPEGVPGHRLDFTARVRWNTPGSREVLTVEAAPAFLQFADSAVNNTQPRVQSLSIEIARVWQGAVLRRGVRLNREGRYEEARRLLHEEFAYFERYCEGLPSTGPLVAEMQTALADIAQAWTEDRRKEHEICGWHQTRQQADHRQQKWK